MQTAAGPRLPLRLRDGVTPYVISGYVLSGLYALVILVPLYFVVVSAFKSNLEIFGSPLALPSAWTWGNFIKAQETARFDRAMRVSLTVTAGAELLTLALAFPAAYAIARIRTRLAAVAEFVFSLGFLIPALAMLVPVYLTVVRAGLLYKPLALIVFYPATKLSIATVLLASYMRTVPRELEESAQMDGASRLQLIWYIFLPLTRPGVITVLVLNFIDFWNEYLFALVLLNTENRTLQIALTAIKANARQVDFGTIAAGVVLVLIPVYLVFIAFQEQIVRGIYTGSLKG
jgi:multiple sugar transport system permease protein